MADKRARLKVTGEIDATATETVQKELQELEGIKAVVVRPRADYIEISYDDEVTTPARAAEHVSSLGYECVVG